jgi:TonB family protein
MSATTHAVTDSTGLSASTQSQAPREPGAGATSTSPGRPSGTLSWLSPRHVGAAVRAQQAEFSACQTLAGLESRPRDGAVTLSWSVSADGSVEAVALGRSSFDSERVDDCVLAVARRVTFPASPARTQVSWTVKFTGLGREPLAEADTSSRSR